MNLVRIKAYRLTHNGRARNKDHKYNGLMFREGSIFNTYIVDRGAIRHNKIEGMTKDMCWLIHILSKTN